MKPRLSPFARSLLLAAAAVGAAGCTQPPIQVRPISSMPTGANADYDLTYQSAVTAINDRDYARALDYLQAARDKDPKSVRVLNAFGVVYDKLGRFDLSARYYTQARALEPDSRIVAANMDYSRKLQGLISPGSDTMLAAAAPQDTGASPSPLRLTDLPPAGIMPMASLVPIAPDRLVAAEDAPLPVPRPLRLTDLPTGSLAHGAPLVPLATGDMAMADVDVPRPNVPAPLRLIDQPTVLHAAALAPFHPEDVVAAAALEEVRAPVPLPQRLTDLPAGTLHRQAALVPFAPYDAASETEDAPVAAPSPRRLTDRLPDSPIRTAALAPFAPGHVYDVAEPDVPRPSVPPPKALTDHAPAGMVRTASLTPFAASRVDDVAEPDVPRPDVPPPKALTDRAPAGTLRVAALAPLAAEHVDDVAETPRPVAAPVSVAAKERFEPALKIAAADLSAPQPAAHAPENLGAKLPAAGAYAVTPVRMAATVVKPKLPAVPPFSENGAAPARLAVAMPVKAPLQQIAALRLPAVPRLAPAVPDTGVPLTPVSGYRVEVVNASGLRDGAEPIRRGLAAMGWWVPAVQIAEKTVQRSTILTYPASGKVTVMAWARTLPFRVQLAAGEGDGMRLVVGTDFLSWQGKNRRVAEVWRKPLTIVAQADIPQHEAQ